MSLNNTFSLKGTDYGLVNNNASQLEFTEASSSGLLFQGNAAQLIGTTPLAMEGGGHITVAE